MITRTRFPALITKSGYLSGGCPDNQGCQMVEAQLQLHGWSRKRRVVAVRQRVRGGIARERRIDGKQLRLDLAGPSVHEGDRLWVAPGILPGLWLAGRYIEGMA